MTHTLHDLFGTDDFVGRHIGPRPDDLRRMLDVVGAASVDELVDEALPGLADNLQSFLDGELRNQVN